jgi:hypothetical protein
LLLKDEDNLSGKSPKAIGTNLQMLPSSHVSGPGRLLYLALDKKEENTRAYQDDYFQVGYSLGQSCPVTRWCIVVE